MIIIHAAAFFKHYIINSVHQIIIANIIRTNIKTVLYVKAVDHSMPRGLRIGWGHLVAGDSTSSLKYDSRKE